MTPEQRAEKVGATMFAVDVASKDTMGMELLACGPGRATMRMARSLYPARPAWQKGEENLMGPIEGISG